MPGASTLTERTPYFTDESGQWLMRDDQTSQRNRISDETSLARSFDI